MGTRDFWFLFIGKVLSCTLNSCSVEIRRRSKQNCRNDQFRYYTGRCEWVTEGPAEFTLMRNGVTTPGNIIQLESFAQCSALSKYPAACQFRTCNFAASIVERPRPNINRNVVLRFLFVTNGDLQLSPALLDSKVRFNVDAVNSAENLIPD